ncbi:hypothetical protein FG297_20175 [Vibrio alginolyticus]|nr:hypothetical protein [Vibrio vulnificus]EGR0148827.1 hypothetical protein [Vibrio alginolyticus]EHA1078279.1 hypothetical protein [Vibrio alginolyticus]EHA1136720.1 hypothetical protein [Vibrio alginolyticus]NVC43601.1 hypothetical protein [Vibrio vulnificus]
MNLSSRKTCQNSWIASLVFIVGWLLIPLAQSVVGASQSKLSFSL